MLHKFRVYWHFDSSGATLKKEASGCYALVTALEQSHGECMFDSKDIPPWKIFMEESTTEE